VSYLLLDEVEFAQGQHDKDEDDAETRRQQLDVLVHRTITFIVKTENTNNFVQNFFFFLNNIL
jgi:hypothetical protein